MRNLFDIDLNLLVSLDAILTTRSVTAAAERVGLSKPAMSHALNRIRQLFGDEILVRSGKNWILTERASALTAPLAELLAGASSLVFADQALNLDELAREFRIQTTDHVISIIGTAIGHAVAQQAPGVDLRFVPIQPDDVGPLRHDVDLAIGVFPDLPPELRKQKLFEDRFCCVVRVGHPIVRGRITLKQFTAMHHVLVAPRGRVGSTVDDALTAIGERRRVSRALPYFFSALDCISSTDCVATISVRLARRHAERFGLQVLKPPIELPGYNIEQVWHPRVEADAGHTWLRRAISTVSRQLPKV